MDSIDLSNPQSDSLLFQSIWNTVVDGMLVINPVGIIQMVNPAALEIFGYTEEEIIGENVIKIMPSRYGKEHDQYLKNYMDGGPKKIIGIGRIVEGKTKSNKELSMYLAVSKLQVGKDIFFVGILRDLTEKVRAENDILAAKEEAEHANQAKSHFLSSMSHELRTPLNTILGFSQLLQISEEKEINFDLYQEAATHILKSGEHLLSLIDDVLDLSKIEAGVIAVSLEDINLNEIIRESIDLTKFLATENNIEVTFHPDTNDNLYVYADHVRVRQSLINLISNAIKYNRENGTVSITCEAQKDKFIRINIEDTGYGIPLNLQSKLFIPFDRLGLENSHIQGSGVGLALTKKIVTMLKGDIGLTSSTDGSTFWITLPTANLDKNKQAPENLPKPKTTFGAKKDSGLVLYIEDNPSNITLLKRIVKETYPNATFKSCRSAEAGLSFIEKNKCDLVFMDINLPGISGVEAMLKLENEYQNLPPVIAITADISDASSKDIKMRKFDAVLSKPINIFEIQSVLEQYLKLHHSIV
ncbi:PAS domain S-box protein [Kiloniella antarctica]|uniref:histidine kinase n=1 Tax=Kiloniella antarctica TaxID=1550907 RepID=A0ABW5BK40_9PROT